MTHPKKKCLIADDDEVILRLVETTLQSDEYTILKAKDGAEVIEVVRREKPDLVFLDVNMPGIDGYETCRILKTTPETADVTIVMVTAKASPEDIEKGRAAGADDYFTKPFSPLALLKKVEDVLEL